MHFLVSFALIFLEFFPIFIEMKSRDERSPPDLLLHESGKSYKAVGKSGINEWGNYLFYHKFSNIDENVSRNDAGEETSTHDSGSLTTT